jgi:hypothetical protein
MSPETQVLIYVAPLLKHDLDLFKVGHTTIAGIKGRRSQLRRQLSEPKLELYQLIVYPRDILKRTVQIHERDLIWMVRQRSLSLFQNPTTKIKYEVVYFPTTPAMRFWDESEPDKRDLSFRVFRRAFLLGDETGSSQPISLHQVTTLLDQQRTRWMQVREVRFEHGRVKRHEHFKQLLLQQRRAERERCDRVLLEEKKEKARLEHLERLEAARRIKTF